MAPVLILRAAEIGAVIARLVIIVRPAVALFIKIVVHRAIIALKAAAARLFVLAAPMAILII